MSHRHAGAAAKFVIRHLSRLCLVPAADAASRHRAASRRSPIGAWLIALSLPLATVFLARMLVAGSDHAGASSARNFTLQQAVETALERNPDILRARQEIQRTKGLIIEVRAQALPHLNATADYEITDRNLGGSSFIGNSSFNNVGNGGVGGSATPSGNPSATPEPSVSPTPAPTVTPGPTAAAFKAPVTSSPRPAAASSNTISNTFSNSTKSYDLRFQATQLLYSGGRVRGALRAADFTRDISYFQLRNTVDQVIATVREQFYQVLLNRALIGVQEESIGLLQSQLRDQQNRFEAGTVPRFNVLRAEVELSNQLPALISTRNNFRISQLQLAKTLGLDFDPSRGGDNAPLSVQGELSYEPRDITLALAIEQAKERRAFLKQQRANILNEAEQVDIALGGYKPTVSLGGGYEFRNGNNSESLRDTVEGWFVGLSGSWAIFDGFETAGKVKQARAILQEAKIGYDDAVRQVELEVQQAYSRLQEGRQLIDSQSKNVGEAEEALRLATARLNAGAGTQLEVLDARVALTQAQSTRLQALFDYDSALAEFDRVTSTDTNYADTFDDPLTRKGRPSPKPAPRSGRGKATAK